MNRPTLGQILDLMDVNRESNEHIQIVHFNGYYDDFDEFLFKSINSYNSKGR